MKKLLPALCAIMFLSTQAHAASGIFIGVDGLHSNARHEAENDSLLIGPQDGDKQKDKQKGYGANLGVRFDPLFLFVSGEIFYERLNSSAPGFNLVAGAGRGPDIELDDRFGAKANVGITILPWFTPFVTYGVARVKYETDVSKRQTEPLYGVGLMFDIPTTNISIKAAYDVQKLDNIPYQNGHSDTKIGVAHLGLTYTFGAGD